MYSNSPYKGKAHYHNDEYMGDIYHEHYQESGQVGPLDQFLLLEDGFKILLEDGNQILLENA